MSIGVSFLSFPFVVPPFYQPSPPVSSPESVSFATFQGTVSYPPVGSWGHPFAYVGVSYQPVRYSYVGVAYGAVTYHGVTFAYVTVTYHEVSYTAVAYHRVTLPKRNLLLRSSNLRLRR